LFELFFNLYIDQSPLEETKLPVLIRFIGDFDYQSATYDGRIRRSLNLDSQYPKATLRDLISGVVEDLTKRVEEFVDEIEQQIESRIADCKYKREVTVPDLPYAILESVDLLFKLLKLNVLEIFELYDQYTHILQICLKIFDFNQMTPAQFIFLLEQKKKKERRNQVPKAPKRKRKGGLIGKFAGLDEELMKNSLLSANYYLLKNQISNKLTKALTYPTNFDVEATKLSAKVFLKFMDLRQQFLLDNCNEWIRSIYDKFSGKTFNEIDDEKLFSLCRKEVWSILPRAFKTAIPKADQTQEKVNSVRYLKDRNEVYDLPHLLRNQPSRQRQEDMKDFEDILPSILVSIMTTTEEALSLQLMSLLLKMYSQRLLLIESIKGSFPISNETNLDFYSQAILYNKGIDKMLDRIDYWSRNEAMIIEATEMVHFMNEIIEKLLSRDRMITPTLYRQTESKCQEIFYQADCQVMIIKLYKRLVQTFTTMQASNQLSNQESVSLMLTMMQKCMEILRLFIKDNLAMKQHLIAYLDDFMEFSRYNVGQTDLIADLFIDNPTTKLEEKKRIVNYYVDKILAEGNQTRFLNFFSAVLDSRREDHASTVAMILDTFLPYSLPSDHSTSMKVIYGYINSNTNEHEMFLNDDPAAFKEEINQNIIAFKCEPFLFHRKLLEIYLLLLDSPLENIAKIRLRKYFSINYLVRFLSDYDEFFTDWYEKAVAVKEKDEKVFELGETKENRYRIGITLLKPIVAELLYRIHCQGEINLFRSISASLNMITNLASRESERMQNLEGLYSAEYSTFICFLIKVAFCY
jgi:hypothetical protein